MLCLPQDIWHVWRIFLPNMKLFCFSWGESLAFPSDHISISHEKRLRKRSNVFILKRNNRNLLNNSLGVHDYIIIEFVSAPHACCVTIVLCIAGKS